MSDSASGQPLATLGSRFIAIVIDGIILGIITGVLVGFGREAGGGISFVVGLAYYWYFLTRQQGQTPGKKVMNIRVIKTDGSALSDTDAILRYIGYYINSFVIMIGWIWAFFDRNNQGWHDKIAQTYVVQV
ncbi:MAG: RDD family protein [Anaerolineae bacterium]|nr:RDD family protein [Anaerolineae bacterium]